MSCRMTLASLAILVFSGVTPAQDPAKVPDAAAYPALSKAFSPKEARAVYFSADGTKVAIHGNRFHLHDLNAGKERSFSTIASAHLFDTINVARPLSWGTPMRPTMSASGAMFLTTLDKSVSLWNLHDGKLRVLEHPLPVLSACFSPDGTRILTIGFAAHAAADPPPEKKVPKAPMPKDDLKFPDLDKLPDLDPKVKEAFAKQIEEMKRKLGKLPGDGKSPPLFPGLDPLDPRPKTTRKATDRGRAWACVWDAGTGTPVDDAVKISESTTVAVQAVWAPDGKSFLSMTNMGEASRGSIQFWDAAPCKSFGSLSVLSCEALRFLGAGKSFCIISQREVDVYDVKTRRPVAAAAYSSVNHLDNGETTNYFDVSADGKTFAVVERGTRTSTVLVWDLVSEKGAKKKPALSHPLPVYRVVVSPDGKHIATACGKFASAGQVRVWDAQTGKALVNIPHDGFIQSMVFSPDGRMLVTRNDTDLRFWSVEGP